MTASAHRPPVVIIGMHRSGTAMVTRVLERLGLFVGTKKEINHESTFFLNLNDWLLRQAGGAWDHPQPVRALWADAELRALVVDYLRMSIAAPRAMAYLGVGKYLRHRSLERLDFPWGWKDPRNTFTLPLWLEVFPDAKVIHVRRHGVDVAKSLVVRRRQFLGEGVRNLERYRTLYRWVGKRGGFTDSPRCRDLEDGFALWEEYLLQVREDLAAVGERAFELSYEGVLAEPEAELRRLAEFAGIGVDEATLAEVTAGLQPERAYAFRHDPALVRFAQQMAERLAVHGYLP